METCYRCGGKIVFRKIDGVSVPIHVEGSCLGSSYSYSKDDEQLQRLAEIYKGKLNHRELKSLVVPNAKCPVCGDNVFYYENEHGSKVFFDDLGPPWPKHPCTDKNQEVNYNYKPQTHHKFWYRFYIKNMIIEKEKGYYEVEFFGFVLNKNKDYRYLFCVTELNPRGILKNSCFVKEVDALKYKMTFFTKENFGSIHELSLYPTGRFNEAREEFKEKNNHLFKDKIGKVPGKGNMNPIRCPNCKMTFSSKKILKVHKRSCKYKRKKI